MKTISKILSIVLVLSMILGFALVGRAATTGDKVVINQIYWGGGNTGATFKNDFVELYNPTNAAISLDGYFLQQASKKGTSWNSVALTGSIPAKGYYLIVCAAGDKDAPAIPVAADATCTINMGKEMKLALIQGEANKFSGVKGSATAAGVVDFFGCGDADVYEGTKKASVSDNVSAFIRTNGVDTDNNNNDFTVVTPNPRNTNPNAHVCDYTGVTPTYLWDQFKHTASYECKDSACTKAPKTDDGYHTFTNKKCSVCGYQPTINSTVLTIPQAITKANAGGAAYTTEWFQVSGKVKSIDNATYGNLYIEDAEGNEFYIYGLYAPDTGKRYDAMDTKPAVGDTITVAAPLGTYNTTPQAKSGWLMKLVPSNCTHSDVVDYVCQTCGAPVGPAADSTLTYAEVGKVATAFGAGTTPNKYWVEGEITEIYNTTYGNMKIKDANGNILVIYGSYDSTGAKRYDKMDNPHKVGDKVKVYGAIGSYQGEPQIINGWVTVLNGGGSNSPGNNNPKDADPVVLIPTIIMMVLSGTGAAIIGKKKF